MSLEPTRSNDNFIALLQRQWPLQGAAIRVPCLEAGREGDDLTVYDWAQLRAQTARWAQWLQDLALPAGSRVVAQVDKSPEALFLYLATLAAGLVFVPLNTAYRATELAYFLRDAAPAVVVCAPANATWMTPLALEVGCRYIETLGVDGTGTLCSQGPARAPVLAPVPCTPDTLAAILYTSGTTGQSKGAMLTHGNLAANARALHTLWQWRQASRAGDDGDVLLHALPLFHVHGLFVACHGALLSGATMLWLTAFDADAVVRLLARATVFMGVPTYYVRMLATAGLATARYPTMRLFLCGSAPLQLETWHAFYQVTGHGIVERYGMSETLILTSNPCQGDRKAGTVGPAVPGVTLRLANASDATHGVGEIEVAGPNVFAGYWGRPEMRATDFTHDGYFRTGDLGTVDADGYVTIVGRSKDLIITGGYNVYPKEIELYLNALPGVHESAVFGVPHPDFGEAVVAVVVPQAGAVVAPDVLRARLKATIANYKVPKSIAVAASLPRNAMGKVQKNVLRAQFTVRL